MALTDTADIRRAELRTDALRTTEWQTGLLTCEPTDITDASTWPTNRKRAFSVAANGEHNRETGAATNIVDGKVAVFIVVSFLFERAVR
jgi:uncharacterized protein YcsI (UPF0317 family)